MSTVAIKKGDRVKWMAGSTPRTGKIVRIKEDSKKVAIATVDLGGGTFKIPLSKLTLDEAQT